MKRFYSLTLIIFILAIALTSCSNSPSDSRIDISSTTSEDILSVEKCEELADALEAYLLVRDACTMAVDHVGVLSSSEYVRVYVSTYVYETYSFTAVATESVKWLQEILPSYGLTSAELHVTTPTGKEPFASWKTEDLKSGVLLDTKDSTLKTVTLEEMQNKYSYEGLLSEIKQASADSNSASEKESISDADIIPSETVSSEFCATELVGVKIHSRPGDQYFVYDSVESGTILYNIIGYVEDGEWVNLIYKDKNAYIRSKCLILAADGKSGTVVLETK